MLAGISHRRIGHQAALQHQEGVSSASAAPGLKPLQRLLCLAHAHQLKHLGSQRDLYVIVDEIRGPVGR